MMAVPKVIFPMADSGHDPTETAVPYTAFKEAGFEIFFATELGEPIKCDPKMLYGVTQKLLGATKSAVKKYKIMAQSLAFQNPLSWSSPTFTLAPYDLVFLPGGHEKGVRQLIDSPEMAAHIGAYFPGTRKPGRKTIAAVCHGVMALANASYLEGKDRGRSVLHDCTTTALPARFEQTAFWSTRLFLGDYYKTYGAGSEDVEQSVKMHLDNPGKQFKSSLEMTPFVVEDEKYNYISARFPGDVQMMAAKVVAQVKSNMARPEPMPEEMS